MLSEYLQSIYNDQLDQIYELEQNIKVKNNELQKCKSQKLYLNKAISNDDLFNPNAELLERQNQLKTIDDNINQIDNEIKGYEEKKKLVVSKKNECARYMEQLDLTKNEDFSNVNRDKIAKRVQSISSIVLLDLMRAKIELDELICFLK